LECIILAAKKAIIVLSFLLIVASAFLPFPFESADFDGVNNYAHDSKAAINTGIHNSTIAILNHSSQKITLKVPASKIQLFYEASFFSFLYSTHFSNKEYVVNIRKKIKRIVYSHFNGTKYKDNTFVI
jgi:hypothetical protein